MQVLFILTLKRMSVAHCCKLNCIVYFKHCWNTTASVINDIHIFQASSLGLIKKMGVQRAISKNIHVFGWGKSKCMSLEIVKMHSNTKWLLFYLFDWQTKMETFSMYLVKFKHKARVKQR